MSALRVFIFTTLAIFAFAGNSLLTRFALVETHLEPAQFAGIRLISGAIMLAALASNRSGDIVPKRADLVGAFSLFAYAVTFTLAYLSLGAATGALILFGSVQLTLAGLSSLRGTVPKGRALIGLVVAFAGLAWMLMPRVVAPPLGSALLMFAAGIAWGVYTMAGRVPGDPVARTARNFLAASVPVLIWWGVSWSGLPSWNGFLLAAASGMITSALGYAIWYAVLPHLNVSTAGAAQLLVPVVAAAGAALWLREPISAQLLISGVIILSGIALTLGNPKPKA